jgi:predicted phage baseplate assembly protein
VADEVLGSGDAASTFQSFALKKYPVTFVSQAGAKNGAANSLEIRVDGVLWQETDHLYGQKADGRVYTSHIDDDGAMTVRFGDGQTGARLTSGSSNVLATYRQGIGAVGNVDASSLTTLLDKPTGLKKVTNPGAAEGGSEPESLDQARDNAPNTIRTFDRIVSLRDFEDAARAYAGVAKARASWQWDGLEQGVLLTVAGDGGAEIEAGSQTHQNLVADLNSRRDPYRRLTVQGYEAMPIEVEAAIAVDEAYDQDDVQADALSALSDYFAFDNRDLGQAIHLSDVYRVLQEVTGVVAVDVDYLNYRDSADRTSHGASDASVQAHLAIRPNELATVEDETEDLVVNLKDTTDQGL